MTNATNIPDTISFAFTCKMLELFPIISIIHAVSAYKLASFSFFLVAEMPYT